MFDEAYGTLPEKPPTLSKEVYRERQTRLLSQLDVDDLIIVSSLPEGFTAEECFSIDEPRVLESILIVGRIE